MKVEKISLIEPRAADYHIFSRFPLPRLGLPIIATILRDAGYEVDVYCEDLRPLHPSDYWKIAHSDIIGISITTSTAPRGYFLASVFRRAKKPIVFGGVHATFMSDETLAYGDYCIRGEGEESFPELLEVLKRDGDLTTVAGLSFRKGGEVFHNPPRERVKDLDALPIPDLTLIHGHERLSLMPVLTSRGCPHDCNFCSVTPMFGRKFRTVSPARAVEEIKRFKDGSIFIYDDNFTANKARAKEILRRMLHEDIKPRWSAQAAVDVARDTELLDLMRRTNCTALCIGFESINQAALESMNKRQTVEEIRECVRMLHRFKIGVHGMFIFGADEDTPETIRATLDFIKRAEIETVQFAVLTPLPGTRFYEMLEEEGRIFSKNWSLYDGHHVVFVPKHMTPFELQTITLKAYKNFYSIGQCLKSFHKFQIVTALFRWCGRRIIKQWEQSNREFLAALKRSFSNLLKLPSEKNRPETNSRRRAT